MCFLLDNNQLFFCVFPDASLLRHWNKQESCCRLCTAEHNGTKDGMLDFNLSAHFSWRHLQVQPSEHFNIRYQVARKTHRLHVISLPPCVMFPIIVWPALNFLGSHEIPLHTQILKDVSRMNLKAQTAVTMVLNLAPSNNKRTYTLVKMDEGEERLSKVRFKWSHMKN